MRWILRLTDSTVSHDPGYPGSLESNDIKSTGVDKEGTFWLPQVRALIHSIRSTGKVRLHIRFMSLLSHLFLRGSLRSLLIYHVSGNPLAVSIAGQTSYGVFISRGEFDWRCFDGHRRNAEDQNGFYGLATNGAGAIAIADENVCVRSNLSSPAPFVASHKIHSGLQAFLRCPSKHRQSNSPREMKTPSRCLSCDRTPPKDPGNMIDPEDSEAIS